MQAVQCEEIILRIENKVGQLEVVSSAIKAKGINITAISAWGEGQTAVFRLITSDNVQAKAILAPLGQVEMKGVIMIEMPDEVGQLEGFAAKLKSANIDLTHIYGTTCKPNQSAHIVFSSSDNTKALQILSA